MLDEKKKKSHCKRKEVRTASQRLHAHNTYINLSRQPSRKVELCSTSFLCHAANWMYGENA
eukprot:scaffold923_cov256-Pinguiococcus_pyrenoidosus.AAC.31